MSAAPPSFEERLRDLRGAARAPDGNVASLVRSYLEEGREYLAELHRRSGTGQVVNEANSDMMDRLVRRLFALAEEGVLAAGGEVESGTCVVAVGGYARREMSIHSDVDLLVLYREPMTPYVSTIAQRLQYWLWDAGVSVGCATRTIEDTVQLGREDATVRTAVLTARFLCGDGDFFHDFSGSIRRELVPDVRSFILEQREAMVQRHKQYGESLFLLQPNLKEGAGGLRDYHSAYWAARGAEASVREPQDLLHMGLLTELEMGRYLSALDFLWRVRNDLHLRSRRRTDQMSFELQELVAESLGYGPPPATDGEGGELPVERFMGDYYRHARVVQNCSELVIELCLARVDRARRRVVEPVEEGFRLADEHLEIPHGAHLRERPVRLLQAFFVAQRHDVPLSRMAKRLVSENLDLVDEDFRRSPETTQAFLDVLGAEHRVMRTLMDMNEVGLLAALIPEWEHVVCRWQHVIYHTYTVDVHSIFLVEELRRLWKREYEEQVPDLTELIHANPDKPVLFLGCLLHDIGKGFGVDHSAKGTLLAADCLQRMGLEPARAARALFLVQEHLRMSHLAQRRDLSDPKLILDFARLCGDRQNLRNLYLLTFADIRASSRDAWNEWKGQLLRELFERTAELLEVGADPGKAIELVETRVEIRVEKARAELLQQGVEEELIRGFLDVMPRRYFVSHTPKQIARHAQVMLRFQQGDPMATAFREMRGFTEFILCAPDVLGLFATVTGVLMARGINILGSHVYTTRSGLALEIYRLSTPPGGEAERELAWRELEAALESVLSGGKTVEELLGKRRRPYGRPQPPSKQEAKVEISNTESEFYTLIDVTANDRIGLLYDLTSVIARCGLDIYISKAATILDQVADTFYVKDRDRSKLRDPVLLEELRRDLLEAVEREDEARGG